MEPDVTRKRLIALGIGGIVGVLLAPSIVGFIAGAVLAFCVYEIGAVIDMMGKKW